MKAIAKGKVKPVKVQARATPKRDLFAEIGEGFAALEAARTGKLTLRTHAVEYQPATPLKPRELVALRKKLQVSQPILANYLRTNVRTLENWEQGRAKPNAQATLLIRLVAAHPETVEKLARL